MEAREAERDVRVARLPWTTDQNPYQRELYAHLRREGVVLVGTGDLGTDWLRSHVGTVDVLHFHWRLDRLVADGPDAIGRFADQLRSARSLGYKIAWTVHEPHLLDPGAGGIERQVAEVLEAQADVVLIHDPAAAALVRRWFAPRGRVVITPIGSYAALHPGGAGSDVTERLALTPQARVALAFGHQRADKDLPLLLDGFAGVREPDAVLVIAGSVTADLAPALVAAARRDPRIRILDGEVDDADVGPLHRLAEVAVLARSVDWTSSSLLLAAALGTPIVAADLPTTRAQLGDGSALWFAPGQARSLTRALTVGLTQPSAARSVAASATRQIAAHSWAECARRTAAAFRAVTATPVGGPDHRSVRPRERVA